MSPSAASRACATVRFHVVNSLERDVRRLLRENDDAGRSSPVLAARLRRAFRTRSVSEALDLAVSDAFAGCTPKRRATLAHVLRNQNRGRLSDRSFYRAKKEAVDRLTQTIGDRLNDAKIDRPKRAKEVSPIALPMVDRLVPESISPDRYGGPDRGRALSAAALCAEMAGEQGRADALISEAGNNVRNQFDRRDVAAAFEVAQNEFFIARCRGDLLAMRAVVRSTGRLRDRLTHAEQVKTALDRSEVYLYEGRLRDAHAELDFALLHGSAREGTLLRSIALVRRAQIALACGELSSAEEAARKALQIARPHADIRVYAAEVLGRTSLRTGSLWSSYGLEECQSVFHALTVRTVLARQQLGGGRLDAAHQTAKSAYEQAMTLHYWNLASRCASTVASCLSSEEAHAWVTQSLRLYLNSNRPNAYVADDLFDAAPRSAARLRWFLHSDDAVKLMIEVYLTRFPDSAFGSRGDDVLLAAVTHNLLRGALDSTATFASEPVTSSTRLWMHRSSGVREIEREVCRLGSLVCALASLFPIEQRAHFLKASQHRVQLTVRALRRSVARRHWASLRSTS